MPRIRPGHVNAVRGVALWVVRAVAAFLVLDGLFLIMARVVFAFLGGGVGGLTAYMSIGSDHGLVRGVPMLMVGLTLIFTGRKLVQWIVTVPEAGCPKCGYAGTLSGGRCPECGLEGLEPIARETPTKPAE